MSNKIKYTAQIITLSTLILMVACKPNKNNAETKDVITTNSKSSKVEVINSNFIYNQAPFPSCHASSIVDLGNGKLMSTWFGGTDEKDPDVTIWTSTYQDGKWDTIREVADGIRNDELRYACWNPVLFKHSTGVLYLFYKVGPSPREWWGEMISSKDDGDNWSSPERLPKDIMGPIRAKPIELKNGDLLCPSSWEYGMVTCRSSVEANKIG